MQQIPDRRKYMNELIKKESMKLGVELSDRQAEQFALYYEMLIKKNEQPDCDYRKRRCGC